MSNTNNKPKPVMEYRAGLISATIWLNTNDETGRESYSINISRRYKAKDGKWNDGYSFSLEQALIATELFRKATEYCFAFPLNLSEESEAEAA